MFGLCQLSQGKISESNNHFGIDDKGIKEEAFDGLLGQVGIFCIQSEQTIGWDWFLSSCSVRGRNT